jgi:hypothetical protein
MKFYWMRWVVQWAELIDAFVGVLTLGFVSDWLSLSAESWFLDNCE